MDNLKDEREAAIFLNVSVSGLRKWRNAGKGPKCYRLGRLVRYKQSDLENWLETQKSGTSVGSRVTPNSLTAGECAR